MYRKEGTGPLGAVTVLGAHILDVLGRPVGAIPPGQGSVRLTEIRATAAGTAAGTDIDLAKLGADVLALGAGGVAVTCGADGCLVAWRGGGTPVSLPAIEVDVVDTTGCGDAFTAGMLAGLLAGADPVDAAWLGIACGSLVATGLGSDAGIESLGQVLGFLGRAQPDAAARIAAAAARRPRQQEREKEQVHD
jgi:sugar/nucleoside kinase (ribokinase family)